MLAIRLHFTLVLALHSIQSWFQWNTMDRRDSSQSIPPKAGTFVVRCSSRPGCFAVEYTLEDNKERPQPALIINDNEGELGTHSPAPVLHAFTPSYSVVIDCRLPL
jgi:hypothetical protein